MSKGTIKARNIEEYCCECDNQLNTWDKRIYVKFMYQLPTCERCIAYEYGMEQEALRDHMAAYFGMKPCEGI